MFSHLFNHEIYLTWIWRIRMHLHYIGLRWAYLMRLLENENLLGSIDGKLAKLVMGKKCLAPYTNRPISQIPQCNRQLSHNATFWNRNVHSHPYYSVWMAIWKFAFETISDSGFGRRSPQWTSGFVQYRISVRNSLLINSCAFTEYNFTCYQLSCWFE